MKIRIIPSLLMDKSTLVKGRHFETWRTVGSVYTAAKIFAKRDVDEILLLDVTATKEGRSIDLELVSNLSKVLRIPFSVGGGIDSIEKAAALLRNGAEKIIIGSGAITNPNLVRQISESFGSQACVVSIDIADETMTKLAYGSGTKFLNRELSEFAQEIESNGAGEVLLQDVKREGSFEGQNLNAFALLNKIINIPIILSCGIGSLGDFLQSARSGVTAIAAGSIFQFTEATPEMVRVELRSNGFETRTTVLQSH